MQAVPFNLPQSGKTAWSKIGVRMTGSTYRTMTRPLEAVQARLQRCAGVGLGMPACPHCSSTKTHKDGRDRAGKQRYRCLACRRGFTDRTGTPFTNHRWPRDVIVMAVRWYFSYRLSAANVRNLLAERGLDVSRQTVADWAQKLSVLLAVAARRCAEPLGRRWFVDETVPRAQLSQASAVRSWLENI